MAQRGQAVPQEAFQGQGAGNGVRVGINQDQQPVFMAEKLVEPLHDVAHVDEPLKLFYLRSCPGANEEAGFFQIMPEISEASGPRGRLGVPDGQFLPMRRFFFAMPGPYIINLKGTSRGRGADRVFGRRGLIFWFN